MNVKERPVLVEPEADIGFAPDMARFSDQLVIAPVELFASVVEESSKPLLGTEADTLLAVGGTLLAYGEGGAGKTTAELDIAFHLAAGIPWLGPPSPQPGPRCDPRGRRAAWEVPHKASRGARSVVRPDHRRLAPRHRAALGDTLAR